MAKHTIASMREEWLPFALVRLGRMLLLMPEGMLVAVLICLYLIAGQPPVVALAALLLILSFMVRVAALHLARLSLDAARYRDADALSYLALLLYPWSADALALRGALALASGAPDVAEKLLRRAIALLPGHAPQYAALSSALIDLDRPSEAAAAAREAVRLCPDYGMAHLYLAEAERAFGAMPERIEQHIRDGLDVTSKPEITATLQCALARHLLAQRRMAEAALALHSAEALLARCTVARGAELRFHIGELLVQQGHADAAREHFRSVEAIDPHNRHAAAAWRGAHL